MYFALVTGRMELAFHQSMAIYFSAVTGNHFQSRNAMTAIIGNWLYGTGFAPINGNQALVSTGLL